MESVFAAIGIGGDGSDDAAIDYSGLKAVKTTIWIDRKTYRPIKITTDMTAFMNGYMTVLIQQMQGMGIDEAADLDISYTKVATTQVFAKYNKATNFTIHKACK